MGAPATWWDRCALVLVPTLGLACGAPASLDVGPPSTSATDTTTSGASTLADAADTSSTGMPPDVATADEPDRLPPGACPAACERELTLVWSLDDEPPQAIRERSLAAMVRALDGSLVVADHRGATPWLTRVSSDGELMSATEIALACDCRIVDMAIDELGNLLVLGEGTSVQGYPWLVLSAYALPTDEGVQLSWRDGTILYGTADRPGRVGSVMSLGDGMVTVSLIESGLDGRMLEKDSFRIHYFGFGGELLRSWLVDTQVAAGPPRRARAVAPSRDELATILLGGAESNDYVVRGIAWRNVVTETEPLSGPADAIAAGADASIVVAGIERRDDAQPVLHLASLPGTHYPAWTHAVELSAPGAGAPAVVVDADGHATVALRTVAGDAPELTLVLAPADGSPPWLTTLPTAVTDATTPVALSLADDQRSLVVAALVDGQLHLERRERGCRCP